ncbi:MAG TPA: FAD-dependent oxidoreductase, partial [Blastocatellia bacterium]|nr:FAD-dependent oxidoreductase [Blastocatellia bacterium]
EVAPLDEMNFLGLLCKVRGGQGERFGAGLPPIPMGYWDELEIFRCADGCQQLATEMEAEVRRKPGCRIDLDTMVKVIDIKKDKVELTWVPVTNGKPALGSGQTETFEFVILAIPPSVWDDVTITVDGKAPKNKPGVMSMAPAVKFFTDVRERFWIKQKSAPYGGSLTIGQVWEGTDNQTRVNRDPQGRPLNNHEKQGIVLSVFAGPILPGRNVPNEKNFKDGLKQLYPDYGDIHTKPPLFSNWPIEPFIKTGYVSPKKKEILTIAQELSKPFHDRLFFAGEHTQMDFFGYMEGALRSGERAAHTLMLKKCGLLNEPTPKSPSLPPQRPAPKSPSPPIVARATPTRETTAFEREVGARLKEHSSGDYPWEAESPFLNQVRFARKSEEEWEPRAAALVAESPFVGALEERRSSFDDDQLKDEEALDELEGEEELEAEDVWEELEEAEGEASSVVAPFPGRIVMPLEMITLKNDTFGACITAASEPPDVRGMCGAVIDLTGDPDLPSYRGHNDTDMVYVGSLAKIYPLLAAFELRRRVTWQAKDMIKIGLSTTTAEWQKKVFAELKKGWQPQLNAAFKGRGLPPNKFPNLAEVVELSPDGTAQLREEFLDSIRAALHHNDVAAAGRYIRALSYSYINGVLAAAGFFDPAKKKGLWISGDFNGNDWLPNDAAGAPLTARWRLPGHAVSNFTGTAQQVVRFLGLMAQGKLVDPASSAKMIELLGAPFLKKTLEDATPPRSFTSVDGKVGVGHWDSRRHDSAIVRIERGPARTPIKYALATLGSPRSDLSALRKLELAYHDCVVARHP